MKCTSMRIIQATENDFEGIMSLMRENKNVFSDKEIASARTFLKKTIESKQYFLAKDDKSTLLGCGGYTEYDDTDGVFELSFLVVYPWIIDTGVGTSLLNHIENIIKQKGCRLLIAHAGVGEQNRYFYDARGFKVAGIVPEYYAKNKGLISYFKML